ncbi:MAG: NHL repeat-containing protein [candidate division WOR-3 bacterium]
MFSIKPLVHFNRCGQYQFYLPNGVALLSDGNIVIADGGNNLIHLMTAEGEQAKSIGGTGVGKYRFKEPVGIFVSPSDLVYVADWHNHRVVIFDRNLSYLDEFGHYGEHNSRIGRIEFVKVLMRFIKQTGSRGCYIPLHFADNTIHSRDKVDLKMLLSGLLYWFKRYPFLIGILKDSEHALNKPNGVAFLRNNVIVVAEKNARCLSFYENTPPYKLLKRCYGPDGKKQFGRLGNVTSDRTGDTIFVCDEHNHVVYHLDYEGLKLREIKGRDSGRGEFLPFSASSIGDRLLCVCGGFNFQVIDIYSSTVVYCSDNLGELHGISVDNERKRIYVCDRSNGLIRVYKYSF